MNRMMNKDMNMKKAQGRNRAMNQTKAMNKTGGMAQKKNAQQMMQKARGYKKGGMAKCGASNPAKYAKKR